MVNPLVSETFSTVAIDFRGWGRSTGPDDRDAYGIANLADDVEGVIGALRLTRVVLVGLSMGAKVAQLVASRLWSGLRKFEASVDLQGLVLVSPAPPTPLVLPPDMKEQQMHAYETKELAAFVASNVLTTTFRGGDLPSFVVNDMLAGNKWAREAWPAYAMLTDISDAVSRLTIPTLVLAAAEDIVEPLDRVKAGLCSHFPAAELEVLHGSGHLSPLDAPEAVARHLLAFLETVKTERGP